MICAPAFLPRVALSGVLERKVGVVHFAENRGVFGGALRKCLFTLSFLFAFNASYTSVLQGQE